MNKTSKFLFSTLVAAAAMTSTAWAEGAIKIGDVSYESFKSAVEEAVASESDVTINLSGERIYDETFNGTWLTINNEIIVESDEGTQLVLSTPNYAGGDSDSNVGVLTFGEGVDVVTVGGAFYWGSLKGKEASILNIAGSFTTSGASGQGSFNIGELRSEAETSDSDGLLGIVNVGAGASLVINEQFVMRGHNGAVLNLIGTVDDKAALSFGYATLYGGYISAENAEIKGGSLYMGSAGSAAYGSQFELSLEGSLMEVSSINLGASGYNIVVNNSALVAKTISGSGLILGNGIVNLSVDTNSTQVFVGGYYDAEGNRQYNDGEALRSTLVLDDVSGKGVVLKDKEFRVNNADITLNANVMADLGNGVFFYLRESTLDLNGHDLVLNSGKFLSTGLDIIGEGTVVINSPSDQACWQSYASSIGSQATVKGTKQFTIYEDLTVYGKLINEGKAGNGPTHIGFNDDFWTDGAVLTVSGGNALVSQTGGAGVQIHGADAKQGIEASKVVVENGATVDWTQAGTVTNDGAIEVNGATLKAGVVKGTGTFTIGTSLDESGKPVATELQIADLQQDVKANENSDKAIVLTGNIGTNGKFRVYGDASLNSFNVNAGYSGEIVSANGQVLVYGNTVIGGNSTMNLNYFQSTASVLLESGSTINTANINIYDMEKDSDFIVRGNLNACSVILVNDYYNTGSGSEVLVDRDGVLNGLTQNGNGRFDIQSGYMTVKGCVNGNWAAGGGTAYIGNSGLVAMLTVDGTYAAADNNNGKFVNTGNQELIIGVDGTVSLINGATFAWASTVTNKGVIEVKGSNFASENVVNSGTFTVSGESTLNIGTLTGTSGITATGTLKDSTIGGSVTAGGDLTFVGDNTIGTFSAGYYNRVITIGEGSSLSVATGRVTFSYGNTFDIDGSIADAKTADKANLKASLNIAAGLSLTGDGRGATMNVDNAYVVFGDSSSKNNKATGVFNMNFTNSILEFTKTFKTYMPTATGLNPTFNLSFVGSVASTASHLELWSKNTNLNLDNSNFTVGGSFANAGTVLLKNGSELSVKAPIMSSHGGNTGTITVTSNSTFELCDSNEAWENAGAIIVDGANMTVGTGNIANTNGGWMYFNDANIEAKKIINNQTIIVGGDTNMVFDDIDSTADEKSGENYLSRFMVGYAPQGATGNAYMAEPEEWTNLTLDSSTKKGMTIDTFRATFFNTNLMLKDDLTINILENKTYANSYVNFGGKLSGKYAELDLGGKTMTVNGQLNIGNADIKNGDLVINATKGKSGVNCVTFATNIYDTDYLGVASGASVTIKEAAGFNIYADRVNIEGAVIAEKVSHLNIGHSDSQIAPDGSQVVVSGTGRFVVNSVGTMTIHGDSSLSVENGGVVNIGGTLTNNGSINVDGGTLTAVTIVNNGSITLNNATFNVTNLTGTGTLTMLGKSEVKDESGSAGIEVESIVVKTESNAVALSSSVNTIVFGGVQEVTETANTEITTLAANESVAIAWHFDVSGIESGESVTIETTIKTGLNDSEINIFHKGDEDGAEWTEADVSDVNYDATTGKLSFKANSFSSYAVVVPEPSMFGLFAGLGALLLVGTRRRRR